MEIWSGEGPAEVAEAEAEGSARGASMSRDRAAWSSEEVERAQKEGG